MTKADIAQLLVLAGAHPRDFAMLTVFLQTGVCVSELVSMRLEDVDLPGRVLQVRAGKGIADRSIELEKKAVAALKSWLAVRPASEYDEVFLNYQGEPIEVEEVHH